MLTVSGIYFLSVIQKIKYVLTEEFLLFTIF